MPHDAREPVQIVLGDGNLRLGVLTDVGRTTAHIEQQLSGCDALVLECNHDSDMLRNGPDASSLKERVGGEMGHLENSAAAELLAKLERSKLQHLIAAHLSAKNNTPLLAKAALANAAGCTLDWIGVADQILGFDWREVL